MGIVSRKLEVIVRSSCHVILCCSLAKAFCLFFEREWAGGVCGWGRVVESVLVH